MKTPYTPDRRSVPRLPRSGRIQIWLEDPAPAVMEAELVESSVIGFRAGHRSKDLVPGMEVGYQCDDSSGRARVIWTHVLENHRVSGFLLL